MKYYFSLPIICAAFFNSFAQQKLDMYEGDITIPTYIMEKPAQIPYFYTGRAYQGAQGRVYPYPYNGNLTDIKKDVEYKGLFLENDFLEICVLPQLGGRLYYMIDKTNGYNVIYRNNVIKPSLIGMLGAWISGGVEWNVPHHHRASTYMPTDYELTENGDGSKTIWVGELEIRHQVRWMVGLTMFPDKAMVKVDIKYINQTPVDQSFLVWANTAVHTNENYQVIYPPKTEYATFHRKIDFTRWPVSNELYQGYQFHDADISYWKNTPSGGSFFAWEDQGQFVAGIDHGQNSGICVVGNKNIVIGKKLWTWGTSPRADMWEQILTDDDGPYIEIMTGAYSNNQPDYSWCHPFFTKEATMYFMPLRGMTNVKESTLYAAVNFEMETGNKAVLEVHGYQNLPNAKVSIEKDGKIIWTTTADIHPSSPQKWSVDVKNEDYYELKVKVTGTDGKEIISYLPEPLPGNPMPEVVKPPTSPVEIENVEELVFTGLRLEQIYNPLVSPLPYYEEALKREPGNAFANLRIGSWYLKEGIFELAEKHLEQAVNRWTTDYTRAKDAESMYLLALSKLALNKEQEAYDNFYRASWDYEWYGPSHLHLSMIESKQGNFVQALYHIEKSLSVDINNIRAREIKLTLLRILDRPEEALHQLALIKEDDPLNLYVHGEAIMMGDSDEEFFMQKMRGEAQNYLDMAMKYGKLGLYDEASNVLRMAENDPDSMVHQHAMIYYFLGYYEKQAGNQSLSDQYFQKASEQRTDYCFPFRFEAEEALALAIHTNPEDYKAWYYWGNLLYDHQPQAAMEKWERSVQVNDEFAMVHRNLGFAADQVEKNYRKAKEQIELAIKHDSSIPHFYFENDNYAIKLGVSPETRLQQLDAAGDIISQRDDPLSRKVLLNLICGSVDEALKILQTHHFRKVEGVGNIHNIWVDAWLLKGKQHLIQNETEKALNCFEKALEYPRNLDIGQNNREGVSHYFIGLAYELSGNKKQANDHFQEALSKRYDSGDAYCKGLAHEKIGEDSLSREVFNALINEGDEQIKRIESNDFFSIFGEQQSKNVRLADAHVLKALGYLGLDQTESAEEQFERALELDPSNFTARTRIFE